MLEDKLNGFGRIKAAGTKAVSRIATYGAGLAISFGALAQKQCEYAAQRYAVDGGKAVIAATALYAAGCGDESECCEKLDCRRDQQGNYRYCEEDPRESESPYCITDSHGNEDCCACVRQFDSNDE